MCDICCYIQISYFYPVLDVDGTELRQILWTQKLQVFF